MNEKESGGRGEGWGGRREEDAEKVVGENGKKKKILALITRLFEI